MGFLVALRFLTTLPVPWVKEITPKARGASLAFFPLIGLILGLVLVIVDIFLSIFPIVPSRVVDILLVLILVFLTGALHLDGLMDTCDGVFASRTREQRLQILKDVRVGAFGVIGAIIVLALKWNLLDNFRVINPLSALDNLVASFRLPALLLMPVLARWAMVVAVSSFPAAKKEGLGAEFKQHAGVGSLLIASLFTLLIAVAVSLAIGIRLTDMLLIVVILMVAIWFKISIIATFLRRRLGGLTGDTYGAIAESSEVAVLAFVYMYFSIRLIIAAATG